MGSEPEEEVSSSDSVWSESGSWVWARSMMERVGDGGVVCSWWAIVSLDAGLEEGVLWCLARVGEGPSPGCWSLFVAGSAVSSSDS